MAESLIEKEEEFIKLNAELEIRTKAMMREVESVMRMQSTLASETNNNQQENEILPDNNSGDKWEIYQKSKPIGSFILEKCFKTKMTLLETEMVSMKTDYKNKCNELKQLHIDYSKLDEDKSKLESLLHTHKDQKEKLFNQVSVMNSKIQLKDIEIESLKKENDSLKKELKVVNSNNLNTEVKLNKLLEENVKSRMSVKNAKQEEQELKESHKNQMNELTTQNKRLEKQVTELSNGFKKQMLLIDNLKKQKMYLESAKLIQISEEEFLRILDWKPSEII